MESADGNACFKAFNDLCENLTNSELVASEELNFWVFECGYKAALHTFANTQKGNTEFLDAAWSTQPSLEQDFARH